MALLGRFLPGSLPASRAQGRGSSRDGKSSRCDATAGLRDDGSGGTTCASRGETGAAAKEASARSGYGRGSVGAVMWLGMHIGQSPRIDENTVRGRLAKHQEAKLKINVGDMVHLRAKVLGYGSSKLLVSFGDGITGNVFQSSIFHVEPRALAVGDKTDCGEIVAIDGDDAWVHVVELTHKYRTTRKLLSLRLLP